MDDTYLKEIPEDAVSVSMLKNVYNYYKYNYEPPKPSASMQFGTLLHESVLNDRGDFVSHREQWKRLKLVGDVEIRKVADLNGVMVTGKADILSKHKLWDLKTTTTSLKEDALIGAARKFLYFMQIAAYKKIFQKRYAGIVWTKNYKSHQQYLLSRPPTRYFFKMPIGKEFLKEGQEQLSFALDIAKDLKLKKKDFVPIGNTYGFIQKINAKRQAIML